jgi:hypothetical protein
MRWANALLQLDRCAKVPAAAQRCFLPAGFSRASMLLREHLASRADSRRVSDIKENIR